MALSPTDRLLTTRRRGSIAAMHQKSSRRLALLALLLVPLAARAAEGPPRPAEVLAGVKEFFRKTARPDGSFRPGIDPEYRGMSDSAYSDLAPVTYAVILHRTFGWKLAHEEKTGEFLLSRQRK